ncbi:hypothetical protein ACIPXV_03065 [Streptomyces libani]|uniref:hypothetical protein n=1 Tax=Streptomyces nigrescens TaxID=1920 RepID=UPI0037F624FB
MIRRTNGISTPARRPRGHSVPLRDNTPAERADARRLVERRSTGPADRDELLDALGLSDTEGSDQ